jgi:DNA-binding NarL/FixJ family response regulator
MHVLIAVSDGRIQQALRLLLQEELGAQAEGADDVGDLLHLLDSFKPDLVILSWALAQQIQDISTEELIDMARPGQVIVLVGGKKEKQQALAAGAAGAFSRSDQPDRLMAEILRVIDASDSGEAS